MLDRLYKKENNLFQSENWLSFQEEYGHPVFNFKDFAGIIFNLPFGKKFIWIQKAPRDVANLGAEISGLPKGTIFVRIEPQTLNEKGAKKNNLKLVKRGSLLSGQSSPKATQVLDISKTEEEILGQMKPKTRYNIRLAEKRGVVVKMAENENILFELLKKTASRDKGFSPHLKEYYGKMIKELGKSNLAHIFVAEHEGDFLAAIMVSFYGEVATYLHGGFDENKRNLMAPYLCQWEAIKYAKNNGQKYYDFWGIAETDSPDDDWSGITRFKEGFGGEKVLFAGSYDFVCSKFWYNLFTIAAKVRKVFK